MTRAAHLVKTNLLNSDRQEGRPIVAQELPRLELVVYFDRNMTVSIPTERLGSVALSERDALVDIAIGLYKREEVSLGRAAEIAGLSSPQFLAELGRRRIPVNYDVEDLRSDLATLKDLTSSVCLQKENSFANRA